MRRKRPAQHIRFLLKVTGSGGEPNVCTVGIRAREVDVGQRQGQFWRKYEDRCKNRPYRPGQNGIAIHGMLTASPLWQVTEAAADAQSAHVTSRLEFWILCSSATSTSAAMMTGQGAT